MLTVQISKTDLAILNYERFHQSKPILQKRMLALYLKGLNYSHLEIALIADIGRNSVTRYIQAYNQGGIEQVLQLNYQGRESELARYKDSIVKALVDHPVRYLKEAADRIAKATGIIKSTSQVRNLLRGWGFRPLKSGHLPGKAVPEEQQEFLTNTLMPLLERAKEGACKVYFVDAAHFVMGAFMTVFWCLERVFVKTGAGRFRFNVLGAIEAVSHELVTVCNQTYINSSSVVALMGKLKKKSQGLPVYMVLDNARYQRNNLVEKSAALLGIELVFLPAYSPHLNLIERLWKYIRKEVLNGKYFENKIEFRNQITRFLKSLKTKKHREKLKTLITFNFQTFEMHQT